MATDYIGREAAIETAFDYRVDVIENEYDKGYQTAVKDIAKGLNTLPAADAVEVVRCSVCRHALLEATSYETTRLYCPVVQGYRYYDEFCNRGEKENTR